MMTSAAPLNFYGMSSHEDRNHYFTRVKSQEYTLNLRRITGTRVQSNPSERCKQHILLTIDIDVCSGIIELRYVRVRVPGRTVRCQMSNAASKLASTR